MRCLVVYESLYGNTMEVARAIALGTGTVLETEAVEVGDAPSAIGSDIGLLIVGGPTHAFGMTRPSTREDAQKEKYAEGFTGEFISTGPGIREWLGTVSIPHGTSFATFDTRITKPHLPGSAAAGAAKRLRRKRLREAMDPESFWVDGATGPLSDGELERAERWGAKVAAAIG